MYYGAILGVALHFPLPHFPSAHFDACGVIFSTVIVPAGVTLFCACVVFVSLLQPATHKIVRERRVNVNIFFIRLILDIYNVCWGEV